MVNLYKLQNIFCWGFFNLHCYMFLIIMMVHVHCPLIFNLNHLPLNLFRTLVFSGCNLVFSIPG